MRDLEKLIIFTIAIHEDGRQDGSIMVVLDGDSGKEGNRFVRDQFEPGAKENNRAA
jgi:hypothetical protein